MIRFTLLLFICVLFKANAQNVNETAQENSRFGYTFGLESPFMSIYFLLPSLSASVFFDLEPWQIGMKLGSGMPLVFAHIANGDQLRHWYIPAIFLEPAEVRYHMWRKLTFGTAIGYRILGGTKGEISPDLPRPKPFATDGTYNFMYWEWYNKSYVGFFIEGNAQKHNSIALELGGIIAIWHAESFSFSMRDTSDLIRKNELTILNYQDTLSSGLKQYRDSVKKNVDPYFYIYLAIRFQFFWKQ